MRRKKVMILIISYGRNLKKGIRIKNLYRLEDALDECLVTPSEIQEVEATEPTEERGG